jgi:hypothetical protein
MMRRHKSGAAVNEPRESTERDTGGTPASLPVEKNGVIQRSVCGERGQIAAPAGSTSWKPDLDMYENKKALRFRTEEECDAAIDLCWNDAELRGVPRSHVGNNTMIVPAAAVPYFKARHLRFTVESVVSTRELPAKEVQRLRRAQGSH